MAIKIEIYVVTSTEVFAAFYYTVPPAQYLPASEDPSRVPVGTQLTAQELQDLKDGQLVEYTEVFPFKGQTETVVHNYLEGKWNDNRSKAQKQYTKDYGYSERRWDETGWS